MSNEISMSQSTCSFCSRPSTAKSNLRQLTCGHSLCVVCLMGSLNNDKTNSCPKCTGKVDDSDLFSDEELEDNSSDNSVIFLGDSNTELSGPKCTDHNMILETVCLDCKTTCCQRCTMRDAQHHNHEVDTLEKFKSECVLRAQELQEWNQKANEYSEVLQSLVKHVNEERLRLYSEYGITSEPGILAKIEQTQEQIKQNFRWQDIQGLDTVQMNHCSLETLFEVYNSAQQTVMPKVKGYLDTDINTILKEESLAQDEVLEQALASQEGMSVSVKQFQGQLYQNVYTALSAQGVQFFESGQFRESLESSLNSYKVAIEHTLFENYPQQLGQLCSQIGDVYNKSGETSKALSFYREALECLNSQQPLSESSDCKPKVGLDDWKVVNKVASIYLQRDGAADRKALVNLALKLQDLSGLHKPIFQGIIYLVREDENLQNNLAQIVKDGAEEQSERQIHNAKRILEESDGLTKKLDFIQLKKDASNIIDNDGSTTTHSPSVKNKKLFIEFDDISVQNKEIDEEDEDANQDLISTQEQQPLCMSEITPQKESIEENKDIVHPEIICSSFQDGEAALQQNPSEKSSFAEFLEDSFEGCDDFNFDDELSQSNGNQVVKIFDGFEIKLYNDGTRYEGFWENGKRNGQGKLFYTDGYRYEGQFQDGNIEGQGIEYLNNQKIYEGSFKNGLPDGEGIQYFSNGNKYIGQFEFGKRNGKGVMQYRDGGVYEGEFRDGKKCGTGVERFVNGDRYEGEYKGDKFHGKGTYFYKRGDTYEGDFQDGQKHGFGVSKHPNYTKYEGEYKKGQKDGSGILFSADAYRYMVKFRRGTRIGRIECLGSAL